MFRYLYWKTRQKYWGRKSFLQWFINLKGFLFHFFLFLSWLLLCSAVNLTLSLALSAYIWPCSTVARMQSS